MATTRDEKFEALLARAQKAKDDETEIRKHRRQYAGWLRAWAATGSLSAAELKQVQSLTRGFTPPSKRRSSSDDS
jgi:hypothetical protein